MNEVWTGVIGLVLGLMVRMVLPGTRTLGILFTGVLGVAGAFGAASIGEAMRWYAAGDSEELIAAAAGCIVLLLIVGLLKRAAS
jgi:uncharacterized membrane protein YeaQ/YmgE (transglycosylase-associated protein family)